MKILVLGASSWVGHFLVKDITRRIPYASVAGTYCTKKPDLQIPLERFAIGDHQNLGSLLRRFAPAIVVNLLRGETDEAFEIHRFLIQESNGKPFHYVYFSSANALEGTHQGAHEESELPVGVSKYGKFKARCELELMERANNYTIFRFAAAHGWAPQRMSRTVEFLEKMQAGEVVEVPTGVVQNFAAVTDVAAMATDVLAKTGPGVFHLGPVDEMDQVGFHRCLAEAFGYDAGLIVEGEKASVNLAVKPRKVLEMFGQKHQKTVSSTIDTVRRTAELQKYVN